MIISTGGTIVSVDKGDGAVPDADAAKSVVAPALDYLRGRGVVCELVAAFGDAGVDSSDISPEEWMALSCIIARGQAEGVKKIPRRHGTDTMAFSAAWLSLTVPDAAVVLTGSQRTPDEEGFDGADNLLGAAKLPARNGERRLHIFRRREIPRRVRPQRGFQRALRLCAHRKRRLSVLRASGADRRLARSGE